MPVAIIKKSDHQKYMCAWYNFTCRLCGKYDHNRLMANLGKKCRDAKVDVDHSE